MYPELFTIPGINITVPGYGAMVLIAFLGGTWWMTVRARRVKIDPDIVLNLSFISLVTSTIGARTFYVIHYWKDQFADNPANIFNLSLGGFEIYGGVIAAFTCCILYGLLKGLPLRIYADAAMPSILFGMGVGRIGCLLFGCCWGGTCSDALPWGIQFPYGSPPYNRQWQQRQLTTPDELVLIDPGSGIAGPMPRQILKMSAEELNARLQQMDDLVAAAQAEGDAKKIESATRRRDMMQRGMTPLLEHYESYETTPADLQAFSASPELRTLRLHPSQLYGAAGPLLLAFLTNAYFYRRRRHGTVMVLGFMLYAVQRFVEEIIRSDNPLDTFGLTISQGVSIVVFLLAVLMWYVLKLLPERSAAEPWLPADAKKKSSEIEVEVGASSV